MSYDSYDAEQDELKRKAAEYDKILKEKDSQPAVTMDLLQAENLAIQKVSEAIITLTPEARMRVVLYVCEYFKLNWFGYRRGVM